MLGSLRLVFLEEDKSFRIPGLQASRTLLLYLNFNVSWLINEFLDQHTIVSEARGTLFTTQSENKQNILLALYEGIPVSKVSHFMTKTIQQVRSSLRLWASYKL